MGPQVARSKGVSLARWAWSGRERSGCWFTSSPTSPTPAPWRCPTSTPSPTTGNRAAGGGGRASARGACLHHPAPPPRPSFRMRQVNIVGTSPPSQPSRKIQTLQAPPDMAPANVTLRTASETSLWLRWTVRLPEGRGRDVSSIPVTCKGALASQGPQQGGGPPKYLQLPFLSPASSLEGCHISDLSKSHVRRGS